MEKGIYRNVPGGEVELTSSGDDEATPSDCGTPVSFAHEVDAVTIRERLSSSVIYSLLSIFLFVILNIGIYCFPENGDTLYLPQGISEDAALQNNNELSQQTEHFQEPIATPLPIAPPTPYPGASLAPLQVHSYIGPTLPNEIKTCPSLLYYHELQNNVSEGRTGFCDDMGKKKECMCQNPTISRKHDDNYRYPKKWEAAFKRNIGMVKQYANSQLDVLLLGDSLTEHWLGTDIGWRNHYYDGARQIYQDYFRDGTIHGLALGIAGDRIPHLLYRMEQGEIVTTAKVIWINIGTNDLGGDHCNVDAVVAGNIAVAEYVLNTVDQSKTRVVLNSLLPRCGRDATDTYLIDDRNWQEARRINKFLDCYSKVRASSALEFFDATSLFLSQDNSDYRNSMLYQDPIHLSNEGYRIWGRAIVKRVEEIKLEMSRDDSTSSKLLCRETKTTSYYDHLLNQVSTTPANRCTQNQPCPCLDPQIPMANIDPRMRARWTKAFQRNQDQLIPFLKTNSTVELILMGDSITELWLGTVLGSPSPRYKDIPGVFNDIFSNEFTLVMGISADKSSYLLHRIQNGELPFELNVLVVWVLIGTNDITDGCNADTIIAANIIVAKEIMRRQPKARVVINSILPRFDAGSDVIALVNSKLRCFAESTGNIVTFFEATGLFLNSDGTPNSDLYTDGVHPNKKGYEVWGRAIKDYKDSLLSD